MAELTTARPRQAANHTQQRFIDYARQLDLSPNPSDTVLDAAIDQWNADVRPTTRIKLRSQLRCILDPRVKRRHNAIHRHACSTPTRYASAFLAGCSRVRRGLPL
jgi:hypothetical protein